MPCTYLAQTAVIGVESIICAVPTVPVVLTVLTVPTVPVVSTVLTVPTVPTIWAAPLSPKRAVTEGARDGRLDTRGEIPYGEMDDGRACLDGKIGLAEGC